MQSILAAFVLLASTAHAQDTPAPTAAVARGRELVERAVAAFERGDFQVALEHFSEAYELSPHPAIEFNIGMCLERLGRLRDAMRRYEHALAGDGLRTEGRARAQAQLDGLRPLLATLRVDEPAGADVLVGRDDRCQVPCRVVLDPGTHVVVLRAGESRSSQRVTLEPGGEHVVRFGLGVAAGPPAARDRARGGEGDGSGYRPGILTVLGAGLVVAGGAGIVGFGLRTDELHERYLANPTEGTLDEGETMMLLTNVSIGVAVLGGAVLLLDVLRQL